MAVTINKCKKVAGYIILWGMVIGYTVFLLFLVSDAHSVPFLNMLLLFVVVGIVGGAALVGLAVIVDIAGRWTEL